MSRRDKIHTVPGEEFPCQFCEGKFGIARDNATGEPAALWHTVPECETFLLLQIADFVAATNTKIAKTAGGNRTN